MYKSYDVDELYAALPECGGRIPPYYRAQADRLIKCLFNHERYGTNAAPEWIALERLVNKAYIAGRPEFYAPIAGYCIVRLNQCGITVPDHYDCLLWNRLGDWETAGEGWLE